MKLMRKGALAGLATASLITAAGCGSDNGATNAASGSSGSCGTGSLSGSGSTFQQNIEQQWIKDFGSRCPGVQVNYSGTGSSTGIEQFAAGTVDFAGSDVVMTPDEQARTDKRCAGKAISLPVTAGGIAVLYNLKGVDHLKLSAKTLADIFQGRVTKWNDPEIAAANAGTPLPSTTITPYHRSDGSGTTSVLSSFEAANAGPAWTLGTGKELRWPGGQAAKGSDGVTAAVKQTDGGVTYAEVSFAKANALPTAAVKGAGSSYVDLTARNVSTFLDSAFTTVGAGKDLAGTVDFTRTSGYPLSTVSYVITCATSTDPATGKLLRSFLGYALSDGQTAAAGLGYAPLPTAIADRAAAAAKALS